MLSKRMEKLKPSATLTITAKAKRMKKEGKDVLIFAAGEPDFNTPENIKNKGIEAITQNFTRYTPADGIPELKQAICEKFKKENKINYLPENIIVSCGGKHSLINAIMAIISYGDEVIIPSPYWVSYIDQVNIAEGTPIIAESGNDFKITAKEIENKISKKTKAIILNSPCNPSGMLIDGKELKKIAELAIKNKIIVISDEVYEHFIYDGKKHVSIASLGEEIKNLTMTINAVSKTYAMTGWRIGYTGGPKEIVSAMATIQSQMTSNPTSISQKAALEAFCGQQESVEKMKQAFDERRKYVVSELNKINGINCAMPEGAFYVFPDIRKIMKDDLIFSEKLLEEKNVAVIPGCEFGKSGFIRISYASSMDDLKKGIARIKEFVEGIELPKNSLTH